ncbi:MAG: hypothetical protein KDA89_19375 [Planctomycetaceae bacterium]|nr:hypothetical protein [Planctomycetaceae bacterium]
MTVQTDAVINDALIEMARSFLQYVAEAWPWVSTQSQHIEAEIIALAARQRQDVADIVNLLTEREHFIDFGSFPTEYTDLQFLSLQALFSRLHHSQAVVVETVSRALQTAQQKGDEDAVGLLTVVEGRQKELAAALKVVEQDLSSVSASA